MGRRLILLATCCGLTGCAAAVREASRTAVPIVVSTGLGELATPQSQAQLKSIAASPAVQEAGYGVGLGIGRGILDEGVAFVGGSPAKGDEPPPAVGIAATTRPGGAEPTANAPTTQASAANPAAGGTATPATQPATGAAPSRAAHGIGLVEASLTPAIDEVVRSAVAQGMAQAMGPEGRTQVHGLAESAADGVIAGLARAADRDGGPMVDRLFRDRIDPAVDEAAHRLGPVLRDVLRQQVEPVMRDLVAEVARDTLKMPVRPENAPDVVANARNVSVGASQPTHEALVNLGLIDPAGHIARRLRLALWGAAVLLTLIGLGVLILVVLRIMLTLAALRRGRGTPPV